MQNWNQSSKLHKYDVKALGLFYLWFTIKTMRLEKTMDINKLIDKYYKEASDMRDSIHREPELAFQEFKTSEKVRNFLDKHGIAYKYPIATTGILAEVKGKFPGKTILLRADMDALPMQENKEHYNASEIDGKHHACGHDGHTAGLCLSAAVLNDLKDEIHGTIKFMFQPAEEAIGGAKPMIDEGVLEGVDMAFGAHLIGEMLEGTVGLKSGPFMASPDTFNIKVYGKGGHGSKPSIAIDPIVAAANIIMSIQTVVSRLNDALEPLVVTIGSIHGGSAPNIIPDMVEMVGTIRTLNNDLRAKVPGDIKRVAEHAAAVLGARIEFQLEMAYPVCINDKEATEIAKEACLSFLDKEQVIELEKPSMGAEDFAYITQNVPASFIYVGIAKDKDHLISHHHCDFTFDNKNLKVISEVLVQSSLHALNK